MYLLLSFHMLRNFTDTLLSLIYRGIIVWNANMIQLRVAGFMTKGLESSIIDLRKKRKNRDSAKNVIRPLLR